MTEAGTKKDTDRPDLSLISRVFLFGLGWSLTFGKRKYDAHNWRKGLKMSRLLAALLRHVVAFQDGEDYDFDPTCSGCQSGDCELHSGFCHLDNAACMLMFARELWATRPDLDDRFHVGKIERPGKIPPLLAQELVNKVLG